MADTCDLLAAVVGSPGAHGSAHLAMDTGNAMLQYVLAAAAALAALGDMLAVCSASPRAP